MIEVKSCRSTKKGIMYETENYVIKSRFFRDFLSFIIVNKNEKRGTISRFFNKINNVENKFLRTIICLIEIVISFSIELFAVYKFPKTMLVLYTVIVIFHLILFGYVQLPKETKNYNSAGHKILNAYRKMHKIPNIYETNYYSSYYKKSKINCLFVEVFLYLVYMLIFPKFPLFTIGKICEIIKISKIFTPLQFFVTKSPSVCNLHIARCTLKTLIEIEEDGNYNNNVYYVFVSGAPILKITNLFTAENSEYNVVGCCFAKDIQRAIDKYYLNVKEFESDVEPEYRDKYLPKEIVINYNGILVSLNETNYNEFSTIFKQKLEERRKKI